jgi:hypothetical protein
MRIFIAGPMSGLPDDNYPAFNLAEEQLRAKGYDVENPAKNQHRDTWEDYLRDSITQMLRCDAVAVLPGWSGSKGANLELSVAYSLNMPVRRLAVYLGEWQ